MVAAFAQLRPGRKLKPRVEIFYEGVHVDSEGNKLEYTADDIDDIARNYAILSSGDRPILEPPIGIDHDTAKFMPDALLSNTRLSHGEPVKLVAETIDLDGKPTRFLFADLALTPETKMLVDAGYLNGVSSEVMDEDQLPEDAKKAGVKGKALRRIALLGYDLPALKRLKGLGKLPTESSALAPVKFSEHKPVNRIKRLLDSDKKPCGVAFFCDAHRSFQGDTMPREELIAWLQSKGVDTGLLTDAVPDAILEMMKKIIEENEALKAQAGGAPPEGGMSDGKNREPKQVMFKYSDPAFTQAVRQVFSADIGAIKQQIDTDRRNGETLGKAKLFSEIDAFCLDMVEKGKMRSAELEVDAAGVPAVLTERADLYRDAEVAGLHNFSEGGKPTKKTKLEISMARIKARPARMFREKVTAQVAGHEGTAGRFDLIRQQAIDSRKHQQTKTLHERMGLLPAAGCR